MDEEVSSLKMMWDEGRRGEGEGRKKKKRKKIIIIIIIIKKERKF
jgi:hypothetical protein